MTSTSPVGATAAAPAARPRIRWTGWSGDELATGLLEGTALDGAAGPQAVVLAAPLGGESYADPFGGSGDAGGRPYERAAWTSPWTEPGFAFTELVASWNATTPAGTWLLVEAQVREEGGADSGWYALARWASGLDDLHRTTVPGQDDGPASVSADTLVAAAGRTLTGWRLRATLWRTPGAAVSPRLTLLGAMVSAGAAAAVADPVPGPGPAAGTLLDVPCYAQLAHRGRYPEWDGGGDSWCSATSLAMVLDFWGAGPSPAETAWVEPGPDPQVVHAVRAVFDHEYGGAGNWPFNTAYAATRGLVGFVTRLRSVAEAELFLAAGIPLVTSLSFTRDQLPAAGYETRGHLMVVVGIDEAGDVVVNDPAAHGTGERGAVRTTYDRARFEAAWARSGRATYVVRPGTVPLPAAPAEANW